MTKTDKDDKKSFNALRACVYIYIRRLSSFRVPTLWFMDLTVATCHIQYTFLSLRQFVKSAMFVWYENGRWPLLGAQSINTESFFNTCTAGVSVAIIASTYISVQHSLRINVHIKAAGDLKKILRISR